MSRAIPLFGRHVCGWDCPYPCPRIGESIKTRKQLRWVRRAEIRRQRRLRRLEKKL